MSGLFAALVNKTAGGCDLYLDISTCGADIILLWTILRCRDWTVVRFCHTLGPVMLLQALYVSSLISSTSTRHYRLNRSCDVGYMLRQHHEWTLLSDLYFIEDREPDSVFHLLVSDCC